MQWVAQKGCAKTSRFPVLFRRKRWDRTVRKHDETARSRHELAASGTKQEIRAACRPANGTGRPANAACSPAIAARRSTNGVTWRRTVRVDKPASRVHQPAARVDRQLSPVDKPAARVAEPPPRPCRHTSRDARLVSPNFPPAGVFSPARGNNPNGIEPIRPVLVRRCAVRQHLRRENVPQNKFPLRRIPRSRERERMSAGQVRVVGKNRSLTGEGGRRPDEVSREIHQTRERDWPRRHRGTESSRR